MLFQNSIGIDIRDDSVAIVHLRASFKGIDLAGFHTHSLDAGADTEKRLSEADRIASDFMRRKEIKVADIYVGVPGSLVLQRMVEFPAAVSENLLQTLYYELEKYVPIPADEVYFDAQIVSGDRKNGRLKVLLLVVRKAALDPYIEFGRRLGRGAGGIETDATALANYIGHHADMPDSQPFLYFLRRGAAVHAGLLQNGKLFFSRNIPAAETEAELFGTLKTEIQNAAARFGEGAHPLHVGIDTSGSTLLPDASLASDLGMPVTVSPLPVANVPDMQYAAAYGLALKGMRKLPMQINLMPPKLRKKSGKLGYYIMISMLTAILLLAALWGGARILQKRILENRVDDRLAELQQQMSGITDLETEIGMLEAKTDRLVSLRQAYVPVSDILKELTDTIPDTAWLQEISLSEEKVQILGWAASASEIVTRLEESPLFSEVAFISTITKDKDGKEKFHIRLKAE